MVNISLVLVKAQLLHNERVFELGENVYLIFHMLHLLVLNQVKLWKGFHSKKSLRRWVPHQVHISETTFTQNQQKLKFKHRCIERLFLLERLKERTQSEELFLIRFLCFYWGVFFSGELTYRLMNQHLFCSRIPLPCRTQALVNGFLQWPYFQVITKFFFKIFHFRITFQQRN